MKPTAPMEIFRSSATLSRGLFLVAALATALVSTARAELTLVDTAQIGSQDTPNILSASSIVFGVPNLVNLLRVEEGDSAPAGSFFTIDYPTPGTAQVSWDLTNSGFTLTGIYVFGGNNGANFYKVTDVPQMTSGSALINAPVAGNSGQFADISHTLFLGIPAPVPEPSTFAFMVGGLTTLLGAQRLLRRRS